MRVVAVDKPGGPEHLRLAEAPRPVPRPGEVLIRVEAAGVNRPDILQRAGAYPPPSDASPVLGLEVAGEIAEATEGSGWRIGERVCALANGGGYAEFCAVPGGQCLPWPAGYDAVRAAALPENFFTVWANLFGHGRLVAGKTVLIHGGSSGIGLTAIQLARAFGATAYATAGSPLKCEACRRAGAAEAIDYKQADFAAEIARLTGGRGVDVILDMVGGDYTPRNIASLARDGRLVFIAFLRGGVVDQLDLRPVMVRRLTVTGSTMRPRAAAEKAAIASDLRAHVWPLLGAGTITPVIDGTWPLAEVADAHRRMESSAHIGKIVLTL